MTNLAPSLLNFMLTRLIFATECRYNCIGKDLTAELRLNLVQPEIENQFWPNNQSKLLAIAVFKTDHLVETDCTSAGFDVLASASFDPHKYGNAMHYAVIVGGTLFR